jgi:hypothetical protein
MLPRAPSLRRFVAGALASVVAVFGVLALRVHDGQDPALGAVSATATKATVTTTSPSTSSAGTSSSSSSGATSSTGDGTSSTAQDNSGWSSGAPTTRAS